jgi:parallel beta-helix repeat protein
MKSIRILSALLFFFLAANCLKAEEYNIVNFGAKPDGTTINTKSIQLAIDKLYEAGGGRLIVPRGFYLTGSIELKSNINLYLTDGAVLLGSTDMNDYKKLTGHQSLILASNQNNISITGEGTIDGQGRKLTLGIDSLFHTGKMNMSDYDQTHPDESTRPTIIQIENCKNVLIQQITVKNAACWVQQFNGCENVKIDRITVNSIAFHNNDGMDITNCRSVSITGCNVSSADDGICLKGSWNDNVLIENCRIHSNANAIKFGSGAGATNVTIKNIYIYDTYRSALAIESVYGHKIENILVDGLFITNTLNVFFLRLGNRKPDENGEISTLKNITIRNVKADVPLNRPDMSYEVRFPGRSCPLGANIAPAIIIGIPGHYIEDIIFENVAITYPGGGDEATGYMPVWRMKDVPENEKEYPEYDLQGELPAWGFYVRHAKNITFKNVAVAAKKHDYRPALVFDDVSTVKIDNIYISEDDKGPQILLRNVTEKDINANPDLVKTVE